MADVKFLWSWLPARLPSIREKWVTKYNVRFDLRNVTGYDGTVEQEELRPVEIMTSRMLTQHNALSNQKDFITYMQHI